MTHLRRVWIGAGTIRVRLTLWYVALLALILVIFSTFFYVSLDRSLYAELDRFLDAEADRMVGVLDLENRTPRASEILELPAPGLVVVLYDRSGQRLLASDARQPTAAVIEALSETDREHEAFSTIVLADGAEWRVLTTPLVGRGGANGVLQVARSARDVEVALNQVLILLATLVPLTLVLASLGGLFLAGRALDPIDEITRAAEMISAEHLTRRIHGPSSRDEVGRLAATFNGMLDRLEHAFRRQRQFTADASHELRTPLAMLTSQADIALTRRRTAAEYRDILVSIRDDAQRMGDLLNELLMLSRADVGVEKLTLEPLALHELADDIVAAMEPLAETHGVLLERTPSVPIMVRGDQTRLTQLVVNLVDNALKYTPEGGRISVGVGQENGHATLSVRDTGVGIAPEHLPHLFERFYRVDDGRARSDGGTGLGLAISQWIVQAHGGEIVVESQPGAGTTFVVRLPRSAP